MFEICNLKGLYVAETPDRLLVKIHEIADSFSPIRLRWTFLGLRLDDVFHLFFLGNLTQFPHRMCQNVFSKGLNWKDEY